MELTREQKVLKAVIAKAWEDESFKQELINSPVEAIKKATGETVQVPAGKTLVVRDQTDAGTVYYNIPAQPKNTADMELNEEQLEAVAGGIIGDCTGGGYITLPWIPTFPEIILF